MWPEGLVPDVTTEERAKIEEVADAADWEPDTESDELDAPITRRKIEYLARKEYLSKCSVFPFVMPVVQPFPNWDHRSFQMCSTVLDFFAVHPENQGKGVGTALLKHGIEKAREMNMDIFVLGMAGGFRIYKRMGFKLMETVVQDATRYGGNDNYAFQFLEYEIKKVD